MIKYSLLSIDYIRLPMSFLQKESIIIRWIYLIRANESLKIHRLSLHFTQRITFDERKRWNQIIVSSHLVTIHFLVATNPMKLRAFSLNDYFSWSNFGTWSLSLSFSLIILFLFCWKRFFDFNQCQICSNKMIFSPDILFSSRSWEEQNAMTNLDVCHVVRSAR